MNEQRPNWGRPARRRGPTYAGVLLATVLGTVMMAKPVFAQLGPDAILPGELAEANADSSGSTYLPLDSWMYPAALRLYSLGYLPTAYLGMRPWTRSSLAHMLRLCDAMLSAGDGNDEAVEIKARLERELAAELLEDRRLHVIPESVYARVQGIGGTVLNDSFHFGQTVINDYGRPYQTGVNAVAGYSARGQAGRFSLYVRGEYQHAPEGTGYSPAVRAVLAALDKTPDVPQSTIPGTLIPAQDQVRLLEATASAHLLGHEISFGKSDAWLGPAAGSSMAWSNNAEDLYSFRINRVDPFYVPGLSRLLGTFRYDFFVGSLKGHAYPNDPWIHSAKISFKPVPEVEIGFQRSVIWGGKGHEPVTLGTFLRGFFSTSDVSPAVKFSRADPGARFSAFDFTWRVPWNHNLLTVYTDSFVHDDVFPVSAPGRAALRPGVYVSRLPGLPRVDLRVEGASTDPQDEHSKNGGFFYFESVQKQGYTNRGRLLGDWVGRQGKGGQAWLTWHLRPDQWVQLEYREAKVSHYFLPHGTTQQDLGANVVLRPWHDLEVKAGLQGELWRAPVLASGTQSNVVGTMQVTFWPQTKVR